MASAPPKSFTTDSSLSFPSPLACVSLPAQPSGPSDLIYGGYRQIRRQLQFLGRGFRRPVPPPSFPRLRRLLLPARSRRRGPFLRRGPSVRPWPPRRRARGWRPRSSGAARSASGSGSPSLSSSSRPSSSLTVRGRAAAGGQGRAERGGGRQAAAGTPAPGSAGAAGVGPAGTRGAAGRWGLGAGSGCCESRLRHRWCRRRGPPVGIRAGLRAHMLPLCVTPRVPFYL